MDFTRVLHPNDYTLFSGHQEVEQLMPRLGGNYRYEHVHRKWEYGLALDFLKANGARTVLEVGGGGSILAPLLAINGFKVTETDIAYGKEEVEKQNKLLGTEIEFKYVDFSLPIEEIQEVLDDTYDAVVCVSTIEHVENHELFFENLLQYSDDLLFITTDFHPSGETFSEAHRRTYNRDSLQNYRVIAEKYDMYTEPVELRYAGNFVYDYTFASMAFKRYHG